jgi:hypothetical protein
LNVRIIPRKELQVNGTSRNSLQRLVGKCLPVLVYGKINHDRIVTMSQGLGLLSGGLDSSLAAALLLRQGIEVTCISFVTPFFGAAKAQKAAAALGIPLIVKEISEEHLQMVKNPRYGYGSNMNPCIDCHAMMFRLAGEIMEQQGFDFIFSGEVMGQRPMSQNRSALQAVAKHSGYAQKILRPLSAQVLPITAMEESGLVDRTRLLDIQGRTRRRQKEYAAAWGLKDYPASGGGCLLTEERFSDKLRDLFAHHPDADVRSVELLKIGRQFRLSPRAKLLVGRNESDNEQLFALAGEDDYLLKVPDVAGPCGLLVGSPDTVDLDFACGIVASYGKLQNDASVDVRVKHGGEEQLRAVLTTPRSESTALII